MTAHEAWLGERILEGVQRAMLVGGYVEFTIDFRGPDGVVTMVVEIKRKESK